MSDAPTVLEKKVLLVEDDSFLSGILAKKFQEEGVAFELAADGAAALERAKAFRPSLILLDLMLPEIDGYEVLTRLKADPDLKDIRVVVFSNLGQKAERDRTASLGADRFIVKAEINFDEILALVREYIS